MPTEQKATLAPTGPTERIEVIDVIRGFAIFGILLVNMAYFYAPVYLGVAGLNWWTGTVDRVAEWLIHFFAEGKFYSLFSFLFGLGLAIQMTRASERKTPFIPFYSRRLFVLLLIGICHTFVLWYGDILLIYALLGFVLLLFRRRSNKTIIIWVVLLLILPVVFNTALFGLVELGKANPETAAQLEQNFAASLQGYKEAAGQSLQVYSQGSLSEIMAQRAQDARFAALRYIFNGSAPHILALFLLGLYVGRSGFFRGIPERLPLIRKILWRGLIIGFAANLIYVYAIAESSPAVPTAWGILKAAAFALGAPAFCFFYAAAIIMLFQKATWQKRLAHYLLQTVICTTIFYSYGFGLYGQIGPAIGLALTIGIFLLQVLLSNWWIGRFRFGPAEWLWRSLTYLKLQPLRPKS
jgi:uncharacterized protein